MKTALSVFLLGLAVIGYVVPSKGFQVNPCAVTERKVVSQLKRADKEAFFKLEVDARLQGYRLGDGTVTSRGVEVRNPSLPPQLSCTVDFWEFAWDKYRPEMI